MTCRRGTVVEELGIMKDELIAYEEPSLYNDLLRCLKKTILQNELAGDRRELWWLIRRNNVGLIEKSMSELSNVTEQEAREANTQSSISYAIPPLRDSGLNNNISEKIARSIIV
jgi:hypothetical protein